MAGKVPSNMARPLIFEFRSYKNLLTAYRNALNDSNKVLLGDRQPSKGGGAGYSVAIYGSNPYDARYDFDKIAFVKAADLVQIVFALENLILHIFTSTSI